MNTISVANAAVTSLFARFRCVFTVDAVSALRGRIHGMGANENVDLIMM